MPYYAKGDHIRLVSGSAELDGVGGIVIKRRQSEGHWVYDVKLNIQPNLLSGFNILGLKITVQGTFYHGIPSDWLELDE